MDVHLNSIRDMSVPDMNLPAIRSKFPLGDRLSLALCKCSYKLSPIQQMELIPPLFVFEEQFKDPKYRKMALNIKIAKTGSLILDPNMIHPFVRMHIVDMKTCKYLAKSVPSNSGIANKESASFLDNSKRHTSERVDYFLPISTSLFDLRIRGTNLAEWDEEFVINEQASLLLNPNVLFLFEILDFNPDLIFEHPKLLNADLMYPIAWGYLRPVGAAHIHMSRTRVQMYKYKFKYDEDVKMKRPFDPRTPAVLIEFNWHKKEKYPSFLEIETKFTPKYEGE